MNKPQVLQWTIDYLASAVTGYEQIAETAYSTVYKINTSTDTFYLKQTPPDLFTEPQTITYLGKHQCDYIPTVIAVHKSLNCFLMTSCGDTTLRSLFKKHVDPDLLNTGVLNYTTIQRSMEHQVSELIKLNTPDWRLELIPSLYRQLIEQEALLRSDGLSKEELIELNRAYTHCIKLCDTLAHYQIPETLNHCDFQENNMVLNQHTGTINIIDWGETVITHPFLSLSGYLWNITYFHEVQQNDPMYKKLEQQCISRWLDRHHESKLLDALKVAHQLTGIFAALGYKRIYDATRNKARTVQQEHSGSIAGCLRSFLTQQHN